MRECNKYVLMPIFTEEKQYDRILVAQLLIDSKFVRSVTRHMDVTRELENKKDNPCCLTKKNNDLEIIKYDENLFNESGAAFSFDLESDFEEQKHKIQFPDDVIIQYDHLEIKFYNNYFYWEGHTKNHDLVFYTPHIHWDDFQEYVNAYL